MEHRMSSYAQSLEKRGLRVTVKFEILPEAFDSYQAQTVDALKRQFAGQPVYLIGLSRNALETPLAQPFELGRTACELTHDLLVDFTQRVQSELAIRGLKQVQQAKSSARQLVEANVAIGKHEAEIKAANEAAAAAIRLREETEGANKRLADQLTTAKAALEAEKAKAKALRAAATKRTTKKGGTR